MSNQTQAERSVEVSDASSIYAFFRRNYHVPALVAVIAFMFYVRVQNYNVFYGDDGISLQGVDSWYHWRTTEWTVENYPGVILVDPWTSFPDGHLSGQFGTLFDFIVATVAMIIGFGDPSQSQILLAALITVPALAALVAVPTFYMGRRVGGTLGGVAGIIILALAPGTFLARTTAGQFQHHVAEVLFMSVAVLAMMVALRATEEDRPIYEFVETREWDLIRRPAVYGALAGFATLLYILSWPPGVVLVGIFGAFFVIQLSLDFVGGRSADHVAFVGVISMLVVSAGTALHVQESGFSATGFDYFQPTFPLLVAAGCVFMAFVARRWSERDLDPRGYPIAIAGTIVLAIGALAIVLPDVYSMLISNVSGRLVPFGHSPSALTVQEIQPPADPADHMFSEFGFAFYSALIGLGLLVFRPLLGRERRAEHLLVVVWSLFLISMALTQVRFNYYLVVAVAVLNAHFVGVVVRWLDVPRGVDAIRRIETYQVIAIALVFLMLFAPLLPPLAGATAVEEGGNTGPHPDSVVWEDSNEWMQENTPAPGDWGGANNADGLDYHGHHEFNEDGVYDYPEGSYGVLSWWDYGHLITVQGERMAHSNPFQSHARSSSAFLTSQSEERAELILDAIAAGEEPSDESDEELEQIVSESDVADEKQMRYVMIDDQMAGGKFSAITAWSGPDYGHYVTPEDYEPNEQIDRDEIDDRFGDVPYHDTTLSRLYFDDADGMEHYRLVHENDGRTAPFVSYALVDPSTDQVLHGENGEPQVAINQMVDQRTQIQLARLEQNPNVDVEIFDERQGSAVKTYEWVEGATITGTVDEPVGDDATVTATVELDSGAERGTFVYTQEAELEEDGSFELTVPYATDDELGVDDGYTDSSVEAIDDYTVTVVGDEAAFETETGVSETAVVEGDTVGVDGFEATDDEEPAGGDAADEDENGADETADADEGEDAGDGADADDGEGADETASITPVAQTAG